MKVARINQLIGTSRDVQGNGFRSIRPVLEKDGVGFSVHKTILKKGMGPLKWQYKNHYEVCYCISGKAEVYDASSNTKHLITKDVIYILNNHEEHTFLALEDTVLISIFNPPCKDKEIHNKDGSYEI